VEIHIPMQYACLSLLFHVSLVLKNNAAVTGAAVREQYDMLVCLRFHNCAAYINWGQEDDCESWIGKTAPQCPCSFAVILQSALVNRGAMGNILPPFWCFAERASQYNLSN